MSTNIETQAGDEYGRIAYEAWRKHGKAPMTWDEQSFVNRNGFHNAAFEAIAHFVEDADLDKKDLGLLLNDMSEGVKKRKARLKELESENERLKRELAAYKDG